MGIKQKIIIGGMKEREYIDCKEKKGKIPENKYRQRQGKYKNNVLRRWRKW